MKSVQATTSQSNTALGSVVTTVAHEGSIRVCLEVSFNLLEALAAYCVVPQLRTRLLMALGFAMNASMLMSPICLNFWQGQSEEEVSSLLHKMSSCGSLSCARDFGQMLFNVASGVGAFLRSTFVKGRPAEAEKGEKIRPGLRRALLRT